MKLNHHHIILVFGSGFFLVCLGVFIHLLVDANNNFNLCPKFMEVSSKHDYDLLVEYPKNSGKYYWCSR